MRLKGNLYEGGPEVIRTLAPGEHSEKDTDMCDVDYVNVEQSS